MKVLSLFSGVGGFDLGLERAGMQTVFQCEWDKHATRILERHWPDVPRWDDVSSLTGKHILQHAPVIDVVAWGSPCQDLSVAGKRAGLDGSRSGLFHEGIRIIKELQEETNGKYPRISLWENVYGALSSNKGADFGVILDEMAEAGALVQEWRVLDAQYFGVPQRRRRVFLISVFDPATAERCPNPLLPVSESVRRDTETSGTERQEPTGTTTQSIGDGCGQPILIDRAAFNQGVNAKYDTHISDDPITPSLVARGPHAVATIGFSHTQGLSAQPSETAWPTLRTQGAGMAVAYDEYNDTLGGDVHHALRAGTKQSTGVVVDNEIVGTLRSGGDGGVPSSRGEHLVVSDAAGFKPGASSNAHSIGYEEGLSPSLEAGGGGNNRPAILESTMAVRRLTPIECERLMGWPDNWTEGQADTHRYKQCGNGVASPVAQWIAQQIINL